MDAAAEERETLFLRYFQLYEEARTLRNQIAACMKDGYFELASARSKSRIANYGESNYSGREFNAFTTLSSTNVSPAGHAVTEFTHWSLSQHDSDKSQESADPVNWFGILPPTGVRGCQMGFNQAVAHVIQLASIVNEMNALEQLFTSIQDVQNSTSSTV